MSDYQRLLFGLLLNFGSRDHTSLSTVFFFLALLRVEKVKLTTMIHAFSYISSCQLNSMMFAIPSI